LLQGNKQFSVVIALQLTGSSDLECLKGKPTSCHQTMSVVVYQAISVASAHGISGSHKTSHTTQVGRCRHCGGDKKVERRQRNLRVFIWDLSSFIPKTSEDSVKGALQFVPIATNT
jgi:hypothetical protein